MPKKKGTWSGGPNSTYPYPQKPIMDPPAAAVAGILDEFAQASLETEAYLKKLVEEIQQVETLTAAIVPKYEVSNHASYLVSPVKCTCRGCTTKILRYGTDDEVEESMLTMWRATVSTGVVRAWENLSQTTRGYLIILSEVIRPDGVSIIWERYGRHETFFPAPEKSNRSRVTEMTQRIPGMRARTDCPACPKAMVQHDIMTLVIHLNDDHHWKREGIADWLDSTGIDLTVHSEPIKTTPTMPPPSTFPVGMFADGGDTEPIVTWLNAGSTTTTGFPAGEEGEENP